MEWRHLVQSKHFFFNKGKNKLLIKTSRKETVKLTSWYLILLEMLESNFNYLELHIRTVTIIAKGYDRIAADSFILKEKCMVVALLSQHHQHYRHFYHIALSPLSEINKIKQYHRQNQTQYHRQNQTEFGSMAYNGCTS